MSQYSYLSPKQERYILSSVDTLEQTLNKGVTNIYQWDLQREIRFLNKIIEKRAYDIYYDADRLNSIKNLIGHIERDVR